MQERSFSEQPSAVTAEHEDPGPNEALCGAVRAALSLLTERQRALVELHFFEGLSQGEIARRLGVTQQVVQKQLHGASRGGKVVGGALSRLRRALERDAHVRRAYALP